MSSVDTKDKLCLLWLIKNAWVDNPMILSHTYKNYMRCAVCLVRYNTRMYLCCIGKHKTTLYSALMLLSDGF